MSPRNVARAPPGHSSSTSHLSELIFGTLRLHETERPYALLDEAWRLGIRAYDTARVYGNGECERILGEWINGATDGHSSVDVEERKQATVITKGGCGSASSFWRPNLDPSSLAAELDLSRKNFGGKIDIYLLHRDEVERDVGEIVDTMHDFVRSGKVGSWGVSNWSVQRLDAALRYAKTNGKEPPRCSSLQESLATPSREPWPGTVFMSSKDRTWYERHPEVAVLGWECLGKGFLAGKWSRDDSKAPCSENDDVYSDEWRENQMKQAYLTEVNFARRDRAKSLGLAKGDFKPEQVAIAWCLCKPYTSHVITATVNPNHLRSNVRALSLRLTPDEANWLETGEAIQQNQKKFPKPAPTEVTVYAR